MSRIEKLHSIHLEGKKYDELRRAILQRDGWRCQFCGTMTNLEVHHQQFRSHSGENAQENLITLCHYCHSIRHAENA